jgi:hypothetical protein
VQDIAAMGVTPSASSIELRDIVQFLPGVSDAMTCSPSIIEIALSDMILRPADYVGVAPSVSDILLTQPTSGGVDHMTTNPSISSLEFSISYTNGLPDHLGVTPGVSEIALI